MNTGNGSTPAPDLREIAVEQIRPDPRQPRASLGDLEGLMSSIAKHGVIEPIVVSPQSGGGFLLIAGHRRLEACRRLELSHIPAVVVVAAPQDHQRLAMQIVENLHRAALDPLDEAAAFQRLKTEFGLPTRKIAQQVAKPPTYVAEALSLLRLHPDLLSAVRISEHLSRSFWIELAKERDQQAQLRIFAEAVRRGATVSTVRALRQCDDRTVTFKLSRVTVTVRSRSGPLDPSAVTAALREAFLLSADAKQ